jgi:hypothetical protein
MIGAGHRQLGRIAAAVRGRRAGADHRAATAAAAATPADADPAGARAGAVTPLPVARR